MRLYFRVLLLVVSLLLSCSTLLHAQERRGYCVQIATFPDLESGKRFLEGLECSDALPLRLEQIGDKFAVRAGFWSSREEALRSLKSLKKRFGEAILLRCLLKEDRIREVKCSRPEVTQVEERKEPEAKGKEEFDSSLSLFDLGYPNDMVLYGSSLSHTFYLPVLPEFKEGVFRLRFSISPLAPSRGYFTVTVNGIPYQTYEIGEVGYNPEIEVPVLADRWSSFSRIGIDFNFLPEGSICESISVPDTYVIFRNSSLFQVKRKEGFRPGSVYEYLLTYRPLFSVKGGTAVDAARFSYFLASLYRRFSVYDLSFGESPDARRVYLTSGDTRLEEGLLHLNPKDLSARNFVWPLKTDRFSARTSPGRLEPGEPIALREFGFQTRTVRGVGDVSVSFTLPLHLLKGKPRKLFLILRYSAQKVGIDSGDRLWISLFANDNLIWSRELLDVSPVQENVVEVPDYALNYGDNTFRIVFSYYPGPGTCDGAIPNLSFTLYDTTSFTYAGVERDFPSIADFLSTLSGRVGVEVKGVSKEFVLDLFKNLGYYSPSADSLGRVENPDFFVVVKPFSELNGGDYPVRFDSKFIRIYNPLTGETALEVKGDYSFLLFQIGSYRGVPALFVSPSKREAEALIREVDWSSLGRLTGNAGFVVKDSIYAFQIGKKFRVKYGTETTIEYYLKRYKFVIIAILIVIITAFTVYLWRRLT